MCGKRLRHGLRLIVVSFVFLALVASPLAAWPFSFGKANTQEATSYQIQTSQGTSKIQDQEVLIQSLKQSKIDLEKKLEAQQKMLDTLSSNLESSGTQINNTKATAESLLMEIESSKRSSQIFQAMYEDLKKDYDALTIDYQAKIDESANYFKQATKATEMYNATKKTKWSTTIGAAAVYNDGKYGIDATLGIGYGNVTLFGGATHMFGDDYMDPLAYSYKAGLSLTL